MDGEFRGGKNAGVPIGANLALPTPTGSWPPAQGCGNPGLRRSKPNPNGVAALALSRSKDTTPLGLLIVSSVAPGLGQPWAGGHDPFGVGGLMLAPGNIPLRHSRFFSAPLRHTSSHSRFNNDTPPFASSAFFAVSILFGDLEVGAPSGQSPNEIPIARHVCTIWQSGCTVFWRRTALAMGTLSA